jgi:hypothetical protein
MIMTVVCKTDGNVEGTNYGETDVPGGSGDGLKQLRPRLDVARLNQPNILLWYVNVEEVYLPVDGFDDTVGVKDDVTV